MKQPLHLNSSIVSNLGPFYWHELTLILAWKMITSIIKCGMKLLIVYETSVV